MGRKQRTKAGRSKGSGAVSVTAAARAAKHKERQLRKQLRSQRRGKHYTESDLRQFNAVLTDSGLKLREMKGDGNCFFRARAAQRYVERVLPRRARRVCEWAHLLASGARRELCARGG